MKILPFDDFYNYFSDMILRYKRDILLETERYNEEELVEGEEPKQFEDFDFVFYKNTGEYLKDLDNINYSEDEKEDRRVLVNIMNAGGVQDGTVSIDTYLQIVGIEVLALESQREDLTNLFTTISTEYKSYLGSLGNSTIQISIEDLPQYSDTFDAHGYEKFTISLKIDIIVLPDAVLSNQYTLELNGEEVKFNKIRLFRNNELNSDLKKRAENKFIMNSSAFQIEVSGLFVSSNILRSLLTDCAQNTLFNIPILITLKRVEDNVNLINENFFIKQSNFDLDFGKIASWSIVFYKTI